MVIILLLVFALAGWVPFLMMVFGKKKTKKLIINKINPQKATIVEMGDVLDLDA